MRRVRYVDYVREQVEWYEGVDDPAKEFRKRAIYMEQNR